MFGELGLTGSAPGGLWRGTYPRGGKLGFRRALVPQETCRARRSTASKCAAWRASTRPCARSSASRRIIAHVPEPDRTADAGPSNPCVGEAASPKTTSRFPARSAHGAAGSRCRAAVVKRFIDAVKRRRSGAKSRHLTPAALVGVIHDELVAVMGGSPSLLNCGIRRQRRAAAGLQGAGKTTTAGKLARHLIERKKRVLLVSTDIRRPAACCSWSVLPPGRRGFPPVTAGAAPPAIAASARRRPGAAYMTCSSSIPPGACTWMPSSCRKCGHRHRRRPQERLFVVDAMAGQDAVNSPRPSARPSRSPA